MKSIDLFCASPSSTAICSNMDQRAAIIRHGTRPPIERRHPTHRLPETPKNAPCSPKLLPIDPGCRPLYHKTRKSTTSAKQTETALRRKSSADVDDIASSTRHLLSNKPYYDFILDKNYKRLNSDSYPVFRSFSTRSYQSSGDKFLLEGSINDAQRHEKSLSTRLCDHLNAEKSSSLPSNRQVVELRVSIHCKGCEGKLRKHISRMEGVTSFSIDLTTKKVTITGNVTPLGVLTSISKVKNAQFWPSPTTSSSSSSSTSTPRVSFAT